MKIDIFLPAHERAEQDAKALVDVTKAIFPYAEVSVLITENTIRPRIFSDTQKRLIDKKLQLLLETVIYLRGQ